MYFMCDENFSQRINETVRLVTLRLPLLQTDRTGTPPPPNGKLSSRSIISPNKP